MNKDISFQQELGAARLLLDWLTDEDIGLLVEAALQGVASDGKPGWTETVLAMDEHLRAAASNRLVDRTAFRRDAARMADIAEKALLGAGLDKLLAHDWPDSLLCRWARSAATRMGAEALNRVSDAMQAARGPDGPKRNDRRRPVVTPDSPAGRRIVEHRYNLLSAAMTDFARWVHGGTGKSLLQAKCDSTELLGITSMAGTLLVAPDHVRKATFKDTVKLFRALTDTIFSKLDPKHCPLPRSVTRPEMREIYQILQLDRLSTLSMPDSRPDVPKP
ncbi:MAG: hypothetical protein Alpg2KO_26000 [Alphaproteobacteria bacterium]